MVTVATYTHTHPILGSLTGRLVENDTIVHFRNIPYATIPARLRPSVLLDSIPDEFDERPHRVYTEYGYACPGRPHEGSDLPGEKPRLYDEFKCLSVTISASKRSLDKISQAKEEQRDKVPVLVYIHGGAFTEGAGHISSAHETVRMAELGYREGNEVIMVSIGYRLGAFAGITCQDLLDEAIENGDEDVFNQGLFDQRKALMWIQNNIAGFGGDEDRVMVFGESAGSISSAVHLLANVPLFSRCAMQSGNVTTFDQTLTWDEWNTEYHNLLKKFNIKGSRKDRLEQLRAIPQEELWQGFIGIGRPVMPPYYGDKSTFWKHTEEMPHYVNHTELTAKRDWVDAVIVGDTFFEGYITFADMKDASHEKYIKVVKEVFGEKAGTEILESYGIVADGFMDQVAFYMRVMYIMGDLTFQEPTSTMANELSKAYALKCKNNGGEKRQKVFRYEFNLPNLFPGSPFSYVVGHHFVEVFYLFLTFIERYPTHRDRFYQRQAEQMVRMWIEFAYGRDPWEEYKEEDGFRIAICDDMNGWNVRTREEDVKLTAQEPWGDRRYKQWDLLRDGFLRLHEEGGDDKVEWARRKLGNSIGFLTDEQL